MIIAAIAVLGLTGLFFALILSYLSKKLHVPENPRVAKVLEVLPGLNCGACGFSGCKPFADAVVNECKLFNGCLPGGTEVNNAVSRVLGIVGCTGTKTQVAACRCGADETEKKVSTDYRGPQTCLAASLSGGALDCSYGCLGFGDCVAVCPVDALRLSKRKIIVDTQRCIGCGRCQKACPRNLFEMVPYKEPFHTCSVACSNTEKALNVKSVCTKGCIGCTLCTRVENSPYAMRDNLSSIDYTKETDLNTLREGKNKCPTQCIIELGNE